jgi:hypothetical protein
MSTELLANVLTAHINRLAKGDGILGLPPKIRRDVALIGDPASAVGALLRTMVAYPYSDVKSLQRTLWGPPRRVRVVPLGKNTSRR